MTAGHALYGQGSASGTILGTVTDNTGAVVCECQCRDYEYRNRRFAENTDECRRRLYRSVFESCSVPGNRVAQWIRKSGGEQYHSGGCSTEPCGCDAQAGCDCGNCDGEFRSCCARYRYLFCFAACKSEASRPVAAEWRNFLNLLFIGAGAVQTVGEQGQMRQGEGNAISINGARPESNNYTLDGMANTDTALSTPAVILSQDAIQEFKSRARPIPLNMVSAQTRSTLSARAARISCAIDF